MIPLSTYETKRRARLAARKEADRQAPILPKAHKTHTASLSSAAGIAAAQVARQVKVTAKAALHAEPALPSRLASC